MSDTLGNVTLIANVWTDLYAETGIIVGSQIVVQNIGSCDVCLTTKAIQPDDEDATQLVERGGFVINDFGDSGAWAFCQGSGGLLNVRLA